MRSMEEKNSSQAPIPGKELKATRIILQGAK